MRHRMTVTMDDGLADQVQEAARAAGMSVSAWLEEAAAEALRHKRLGEYLSDYQREHGAFTEEELATTDDQLGIGPVSGARA